MHSEDPADFTVQFAMHYLDYETAIQITVKKELFFCVRCIWCRQLQDPVTNTTTIDSKNVEAAFYFDSLTDLLTFV